MVYIKFPIHTKLTQKLKSSKKQPKKPTNDHESRFLEAPFIRMLRMRLASLKNICFKNQYFIDKLSSFLAEVSFDTSEGKQLSFL